MAQDDASRPDPGWVEGDTLVGVETGETVDVKTKKGKRWRLHVPSVFTILFFLTIIAVAATWFIPAGSYGKLAYDPGADSFIVTDPSGQTSTLPGTQASLDELHVKIDLDQFTSGALTKPVSVPDSYEHLPQNPAGISDITRAMVEGTIEAADVIVFILVLGGLIGVVRATGAFEAGLIALTKKTKGHEFTLVFMVSVLMVLGGTTVGLEEEAVAFYPILVPIFIALGYDSIISVGAIFLAGSMGTTFSTINPFSVVIASNAAGIRFTEGLGWRVAGCVIAAAVVIGYLYWYSKKLQANPKSSYSYSDRKEFERIYAMGESQTPGATVFTWQRKVILILFVGAFPAMVWGVIAAGWWFPNMASMFLAVAIVIMFLAMTGRFSLRESHLVDAFIEGASSLVGVSLIIGLARGINLVMNEGLISDTILYESSKLVQGLSGPAFILIMMIIFFFLGFVVPSSSGLAVLSMPIMAPLADTVEIPRFCVVTAYQFGQYAMLFLAPTGLVMATLQMLRMQYTHWLRFVWPMVVFVLVFGGGMLVAQVLIYG